MMNSSGKARRTAARPKVTNEQLLEQIKGMLARLDRRPKAGQAIRREKPQGVVGIIEAL